MKSILRKTNKHNFKTISMIVMLCFCAVEQLESKLLPSTFNHYRLSLGAGLGYSPLILMAPKPFNYKPWQTCKPMLKFELVLGPKHSINFGYQNERYKFDINPSFLHMGSNSSYEYVNIQNTARANMYSLTFDYRIYSTLIGSIAPLGRYIFYGFSINRTLFENEAIKYSVTDDFNGSLDYYYPEHTYRTNTAGFRLGMGKKKYLGKELKSFLEYQFLCDIKIGDFKTGLDQSRLPKYGNIYENTYITAMRLSQMTSLFQFTIHYGFSL